MPEIINDGTIDALQILAKLELTGEEREQAKRDMEKLLGYMSKMEELDTSAVEPLVHLFPEGNVFREDEVTNGDMREEILRNAPYVEEDMLVVPKTV